MKPVSTQISFNSKLVGGFETKEGVYGLQERVFLLILVFIFFLNRDEELEIYFKWHGRASPLNSSVMACTLKFSNELLILS